MIKIENVSKTYLHQLEVLKDISFRVADRDFVSILGPSGCGKSTLLRLIAGFEKPSAGSIHLNFQNPGDIGFVFQDPQLLPWRTLAKNVELPLELLGIDPAARAQKVSEILERVGLSEFHEAMPSALSGGMRMRASLARAVIHQPKLLLLDEPFAALDELTREKLEDELLNLMKTYHMTAIFVTHSVREAVYLSNRVIILSSRPGRILSEHSIEMPRDRESNTFLQRTLDVSKAFRDVSSL